MKAELRVGLADRIAEPREPSVEVDQTWIGILTGRVVLSVLTRRLLLRRGGVGRPGDATRASGILGGVDQEVSVVVDAIVAGKGW